MTFTRQYQKEFPDFEKNSSLLPDVEVNEADSMMEESNHAIVDFADELKTFFYNLQ